MTTHEDMMFQFDTGFIADSEHSDRMTDLEIQQNRAFVVPRTFEDDMLSLNTNGDEETLFSTSNTSTLLGQTPNVRGQSLRGSRDQSVSSAAHLNIGRSIVTSHVTTTLDDDEQPRFQHRPARNSTFVRRSSAAAGSSTGSGSGSVNSRAPKSAHRLSLPNLFQSIRRVNPASHHPPISAVANDHRRHSLNQAMVFSNYNNYLNDSIFNDSVKSLDEQRKLRLEQLADKFWLRDGSIDEDLFEESSDEEDVAVGPTDL